MGLIEVLRNKKRSLGAVQVFRRNKNKKRSTDDASPESASESASESAPESAPEDCSTKSGTSKTSCQVLQFANGEGPIYDTIAPISKFIATLDN